MRGIFFCCLGLLWPGLGFSAAEADSKTAIVKVFVDQYFIDDADFDPSKSFELAARWPLKPASQLMLETSVSSNFGAETKEECDNTGCFVLTLDTFELLVGGTYRFSEDGILGQQWLNFVRGGLLFYDLEVELEETFYELKPKGTDRSEDSGNGFYAGIGGDFSWRDFPLTWELLYRSRLDALGDSSAPFNVNSLSLGIGMRFGF